MNEQPTKHDRKAKSMQTLVISENSLFKLETLKIEYKEPRKT